MAKKLEKKPQTVLELKRQLFEAKENLRTSQERNLWAPRRLRREIARQLTALAGQKEEE